MHVLLGLFLIWALMHAAERATIAAGRAFGRHAKAKYRAKVAAYRAAHPDREFGVSRKFGTALASAVGHSGNAAAEFRSAWRQTRQADRRRYDEWRTRRHGVTPEPPLSTVDARPPWPAPAPVPTPRPAPGTERGPEPKPGPGPASTGKPASAPGVMPGDRPAGTPPTADKEPRLRLVAAEPERGAGADTTTTPHRKEHDMAIDTATGGEVTTMEQLLAELRTIATEATAQMEDARNDEARAVDEIEDASADARRASEDAKRVEVMVASLTALDLDKQSLGEIGALAETAAVMKTAADARAEAAAARRTAAHKRAEAAEARHAQATAALNGVQQRHSLLAEAHAAAPHAANKDFYGG